MEGYIAEIRMFAGNFAPRNWAYCQGQVMSIAQNTALFSLLGTTYGGNGQTTFALPDFRGRIAVGAGPAGPGLSEYALGQVGGTESNTLLINNMPAHNHAVTGSVTMSGLADTGTTDTPEGTYLASNGTNMFATTQDVTMKPLNVNLQTGIIGNSQPVNNIQPYLGMNYIICLFGIFPSRN